MKTIQYLAIISLFAVCAPAYAAQLVWDDWREDKAYWQAATLAEVKRAIDKGAKVNTRNKYGDTALMRAVWYNKNPEVIKLLIANGANVNARNKWGDTALMYAAEHNKNPAIFELLLAHSADLKAKNNGGKTAHDLMEDNTALIDIYYSILDGTYTYPDKQTP